MSEETRIRELDRKTVERIAAGEVVERPASVVKELVENSLDADASRIDVSVDGDGTERIAVSDDGVGMSEADARASIRKHTTSKIRDIDDLESGVATLGFRGEALHTVGAVSRTTITTRPRDGGDRGTELRIEGGEVAHAKPAGRPAGTTIEVEELFFNTPARRKYLKSASTEFSHVSTVVTQYALANPDVAVSLTHDGREVFSTTGQGDLRSAILSVYGREVATSMVRLEADADGPLGGVRGYVSDPETTRSTRDYLSTYVNGRYVTASAIRNAVLDAYGNAIAPDRYPFAVLFLDVDPATVDVNVHPRKMEVRFGDETGVTEQVEAAVSGALRSSGGVRSSAPRGRSAPAEAEIRPESEQAELSAETEEGDARGGSSPHGRREPPSRSEPRDRSGEPAGDERPGARRERLGSSPRRAKRSRPAAGKRVRDGASTSEPREESVRAETEEATSGTGTDRAAQRTERPDARPRRADPDRKFEAPAEAATLDGSDPAAREFESLPRMRVLGQLHDTYVVAETDDGMVLIDQHAADERVNYERLQAKLADDATAQALAAPVELELTAREAALFDEYRAALADLGFEARREGERTVAVTAVPAVFADALEPALLRDVLSEFVAGEGETSVDAAADELLADLACYPSVTGNTSLTEGSVVDLLAALDGCENPRACPHGRPVIIELDRTEIEDRFERDYPGHAGRRRE